jgi:hypothetical protein
MKFESKLNFMCLIPKIIFIIFLLVLNILSNGAFFMAIDSLLSDKVDLTFGETIALFIFWAIVSWMTYYMIKSLFLNTLKIIINDTGLSICRPLTGNKEIHSWDQISEFYTSYEYSKQRSFAQIIIYFKSRKKLKISEETIINYNEMIDILKTSPVKYAGFKEQGLIDFE